MTTLPNERPSQRSHHALLVVTAGLLVMAIALAVRGASDVRVATSAPVSAGHSGQASAAPARSATAAASEAELTAERTAGLAHAERGDGALALERLVPVYRARPDDAVGLAIAEASLIKRDFRTAEVVLDALRAPDAPEALRVRGMLAEQANRLADALALYDRAIPGLAQPFPTQASRARVLSWMGRFDEAAAAYAALIADERASLGLRRECRVRLAELTAWKKDLEGALQQLAALLREAPEHTGALLTQGQILEWQGRYPEAKQSYSRVLSLDASHAEARLRLDKLLWVR